MISKNNLPLSSTGGVYFDNDSTIESPSVGTAPKARATIKPVEGCTIPAVPPIPITRYGTRGSTPPIGIKQYSSSSTYLTLKKLIDKMSIIIIIINSYNTDSVNSSCVNSSCVNSSCVNSSGVNSSGVNSSGVNSSGVNSNCVNSRNKKC